jgi:hypothetical protein
LARVSGSYLLATKCTFPEWRCASNAGGFTFAEALVVSSHDATSFADENIP